MSQDARCFAVVGDPVAHSRSPSMHNAAFAHLGLPHRYFAFQVPDARLAAAIGGASALGFGGLNVTVPHKQRAAQLVDRLGPDARRLGAVNTIVFDRGMTIGHNTDGRGFLAALLELSTAPVRRAGVLGTGGAALAVVDGLLRHFSECELCWVSRDPLRSSASDPRVHLVGYGDLEILRGVDLLVNCTTVGLAGGPRAFPCPVDVSALSRGARVIDIVYPRPKGGLLDEAESQGHAVQDGRTMLLWQGVRALEHWLGERMSSETIVAMRAALHEPISTHM